MGGYWHTYPSGEKRQKGKKRGYDANHHCQPFMGPPRQKEKGLYPFKTRKKKTRIREVSHFLGKKRRRGGAFGSCRLRAQVGRKRFSSNFSSQKGGTLPTVFPQLRKGKRRGASRPSLMYFACAPSNRTKKRGLYAGLDARGGKKGGPGPPARAG